MQQLLGKHRWVWVWVWRTSFCSGLFRRSSASRTTEITSCASGWRMELRRRREVTMTTNMQLFRCRPALAIVTAARTPQAVRLRWASARSGNGSSVDEEELQKARAWLAALHADAIPLKTIGELSFSRSSGPGGQNVNK
jgi:hypothetical protein